MSGEERGALFAPFSRTLTAVDAGVEGTGLGLYISSRIAEAHGGAITYAPTSGGGSTFRVTLAMQRGEPGAPSAFHPTSV